MDEEVQGAPQAQKPAKRGGCFKTGCLGCLGVGALLVLGSLLFFLISVAQGIPEAVIESEELSQPLPADPSLSGLPPAGEIPPEDLDALPRAPMGRVVLDLSMGQFRVRPGPPDQPIRVEADYNSGSYELVERFEPTGELGWTYKLTFRSKVNWLRRLLSGEDNPGRNRVHLTIPRGVPISITGDIGIGESDVELGGLWVTDMDLNVGIGEHRLRFSDPLYLPAEQIRLDGSIGEFAVTGLGNASPRQLNLYHNIGEVRFDLRGAWQRDADVDIRCGIGECAIRLPREDVNIDVNRSFVTIGESNTRALDRRRPAPEGAPTLRIGFSATIGEMRVSD